MKGCKKMAIFTNQAQLRYGNAVANSNVAVGEILEVLAATKTDVCGRYRALLQQWNLTDNTGSHGRTTPFRFRDQCTGGGKRDHCI